MVYTAIASTITPITILDIIKGTIDLESFILRFLYLHNAAKMKYPATPITLNIL